MRALPFSTAAEQQNALAPVSQHLWAGGLIAYPTETVYGLGCLLQVDALDQLAQLKQGRTEKAFLLLIDEPDQVSGLHWTSAAQRLAEAFWPGPLTLALRGDDAEYPPQVVGPAHTVA